jgi:hypothetical protein
MPSWEAVERQCESLLDLLDRQRLAARVQPVQLTLEEAAIVFGSGDAVKLVSRGVHLAYAERAAARSDSHLPRMEVCPILLLRGETGGWYWISHPDHDMHMIEVPHGETRHPQHFSDVAAASDALLALVRSRLVSMPAQPVDIVTLEEAERGRGHGFSPIHRLHDFPGDANHYLIYSGQAPHFVWRDDPRWASCSFHEVAAAVAAGVQIDGGGLVRSFPHRSFFTTKEQHFCGHALMHAKRVTARSEAFDAPAVCHLHAFEKRLCCRTCALSPLCLADAGFSKDLPCPSP